MPEMGLYVPTIPFVSLTIDDIISVVHQFVLSPANRHEVLLQKAFINCATSLPGERAGLRTFTSRGE